MIHNYNIVLNDLITYNNNFYSTLTKRIELVNNIEILKDINQLDNLKNILLSTNNDYYQFKNLIINNDLIYFNVNWNTKNCDMFLLISKIVDDLIMDITLDTIYNLEDEINNYKNRKNLTFTRTKKIISLYDTNDINSINFNTFFTIKFNLDRKDLINYYRNKKSQVLTL